MSRYLTFSMPAMARLGVCIALGALAAAAQAGTDAAHVKFVKLIVNVDQSSNCKLALSATIETSALGNVWYHFTGPAGVTVDFGDAGTKGKDFGPTFSLGRGANMQQDIHGQIRLEAAVVDDAGKRGAVMSDAVRADYTCGNGTTVARPIPPPTADPAPPPPAPTTQNLPANSAGFRVTAVKAGQFSANFDADCPTNDMAFRWELAANGSGTAVVRLTQQYRLIREETVAFTGPGTKVVTYRASNMGEPGGHYQGWIGLEVLSPNPMSGPHEAYVMQCAPRVK
jgi:hypothetical protein